MRRYVDSGFERAESYGLRNGYDIIRYLQIGMLLGLDFERQVEFHGLREMLLQRNSSPSEKMDEIYDILGSKY